MPVIIAHGRGDAEARAFWQRTLGRGDQRPGDLEQALAHLAATDALAETRRRARVEIDGALRALDTFPASPLRAALEGVAEFVVERTV